MAQEFTLSGVLDTKKRREKQEVSHAVNLYSRP